MEKTTTLKATQSMMSSFFKELRNFRRGRVSVAQEIRRQTIFRKNLEALLQKRVNTAFRRFLRSSMFLYRETGIYEPEIARDRLNEELFPVMLSFYRRVFLATYQNNEEYYNRSMKDEAEAVVFGKNKDIEILVKEYFRTKELILAGISTRQARQIGREIEKLRAEELTLPQIAREVTKKFTKIQRSRAALIARTETHNAASFANHKYHMDIGNDLGLNLKKRWCAVNDDRTRSFHASANGQTVDANSDFIVNGMPMAHAGDSRGGAKNVINCRCVILYVDENDIVR
jgi:hypothetical protein